MQNLNLLFNKTYYYKIAEYKTDHYKLDSHGKKVKDGTMFSEDMRRKNIEITGTLFYESDYLPCPIPGASTFCMETTYPGMLMGTGYAHGSGLPETNDDINCGFTLDYVTGQPYLPGSSVKGILHSVFYRHPEVVQAFLAELSVNLSREQCAALEKSIFGSVYTLREDGTGSDGEIFKKDGIDVFLDAAVKHGNGEGRILGLDYITPHTDPKTHKPAPTKNPIPVLILKILPKVVFEFRFVLRDSVIECKDENGKDVFPPFTVTKGQKKCLFRSLIELMGAGAKTNVGYGALKPVEDTSGQQTEPAVEQPVQAAAPEPKPEQPAPQKPQKKEPEAGQIVKAEIVQIQPQMLTVRFDGTDGYITAAEVHGNPFEKLNQCRDLKVGNMISAKVLEKKNGFCFLSIVQAQPSEEA